MPYPWSYGDLLTASDLNAAVAAATENLASPPAIGNTAPNTATFTTLTASGTVSGAGFVAWAASPPAIGNTTPAAGKFTVVNSGALNPTWPGSLYSVPVLAQTSVNAVSPYGQTAIYAASRTSENDLGVSPLTIANQTVIVSDNASAAVPAWGNYWQGVKTATALAASHYLLEASLENLGASVAADPFTDNPSGQTYILRLDSGYGIGTPNNVTAAIDIVPNPGKFNSAIVISNGALDRTSGTGEALALGQNHAINWYSAAASKAWQIYANATSGTNTLILGNSAATFSSSLVAAGPISTTSTSAPQVYLNTAAGNYRLVAGFSGGSERWAWGVDNVAEGGANAGSNWVLINYSDAAGFISNAISVARATGKMTVAGGIEGTALGAATPAAASVTQLNLTTSAGPNIRSGTGAASGTQPKGSLWMRTDGGVGTTMYVSQGGGTWNPVAGV